MKETLAQWQQKKIFINVDVFCMLQYHLKEEALPLLQQGLQTTTGVGGNDYYRNMIRLLTENFSPAAYLPVLWCLVTSKSKVVRELMTGIVVEKDSEAEKKAIVLLKHKNAEARQTGALILRSFNSPEAIVAVNELLNKETNDNARDIFLQIVKDSLPQQADAAFRQQLIHSAEQRNKLAKPIETWLEETALPPLHYQSGEALSTKEVRFLFYRMSRVKGMRSDVEANYLLQSIDKQTADEFAKAIVDNYIANGTKPEHKYVLALAALLSTEDVVDRIRTLINRWIEEGRLKMAEYGVGALALQGSNKALRWVEWYSRKYKTKKANVGTAALQALQDAAEELSITIHELGDRVVPDFGFDGLFKTFSVNGEEYRAFIDSRFKLCFFNEDNKQLKALPAAAGSELKEEFKQIGKEVRDVVRSQSGRMEYYLLIQRRWTSGAWKDFFLSNPVMFIYATKLLWGIYSEERQLVKCFVCLEDTTLVNANDDEIDVEENCLIGIVHPLELSAEQLEAWKRKFFDLSIEPVFPQLDRLIYEVKPEDASRKIIQLFAGKETQPNSIKSTLERFGWRDGGTGDGGYIDSFHLDDSLHGILAVLEVDGVFVSFGWENEAKLGKLYFLDKTKQQSKWVQSPADEKDARLVALKDLPPVLYSEVMYNLNNIKLKGSEIMVAP